MVAIFEKPKFVGATVDENQTSGMRELVALCPECKAFETLTFNNGRLIQTRKFSQYGSEVYHDCGCNRPCRMFRTS